MNDRVHLVHSLVYTCMARQPISDQDIENILTVSRRNNAARAITGILFYRKRQFLQVLEGDEAAIAALMQTIANDPRQTGLAVLAQGKQPRLFGRWSMYYKSLEAAPEVQGNEYALAPLPLEVDGASLRLRKLIVNFMNI